MARSHFVKKARKDYPDHGIKKGDSYYWWKFMVGGRGGPKHVSKTPPKPSQLTQSEFLSLMADIEDRIANISNIELVVDSLECERDSIVDEIRQLGEEQEEKVNNMPDSLQQGSTGEMLSNRAEECESMATELEQVDIINPVDEATEDEIEEHWQEIIDELQAVSYNGE